MGATFSLTLQNKKFPSPESRNLTMTTIFLHTKAFKLSPVLSEDTISKKTRIFVDTLMKVMLVSYNFFLGFQASLQVMLISRRQVEQ